jgi:GcrA cell cycle regulator
VFLCACNAEEVDSANDGIQGAFPNQLAKRETGLTMSWTDERVEMLKQLWLDGKSASQISSTLGNGVTRNAVIGKVHRLGLAGRPKTSTPSVAPARAPRLRAAPHRISGSLSVARPRVVGNTALAAIHEFHLDLSEHINENVVVPMSVKVTIVDLKEAMCKWPLGDPTTPEFRYCGASANGAPYCSYHAKLAYQPTQERRRDRAARW